MPVINSPKIVALWTVELRYPAPIPAPDDPVSLILPP
jgi:hypothetical protein